MPIHITTAGSRPANTLQVSDALQTSNAAQISNPPTASAPQSNSPFVIAESARSGSQTSGSQSRSESSRSQRSTSRNETREDIIRAVIQSPELRLALARRDRPHDPFPTVPSNRRDICYISLRQLRIDDEIDANLVTLPDQPLVRIPDIRPLPHAETDALHGHAFFVALDNDPKLPANLRVLCKGNKLGRNLHLAPEAIQNHEDRLRMVASECRLGSAEFLLRIGSLAEEAMVFCGDRTDYFIEQMHAAAILENLCRTRTVRHESTLYNLGIAYCKLNALREAVGKIVNGPQGNQPNSESVEDYLYVEYLLQEPLGLPTRHNQPRYGGTGAIEGTSVEGIGQQVIQRLLEKDGSYVFEFMSRWEPWVQYIEQRPAYRGDFEDLYSIFSNRIESYQREAERGQITEQDLVEKANQCMDQHRVWKSELVGQKSREILMNVRADVLATQGHYPTPLALEGNAI